MRPKSTTMEVTLTISHAQWSDEVRVAMSYIYAPYNMSTTAYRYATSPQLQSSIRDLMTWASARMTSQLSKDALRLARTCSRIIVNTCEVVDQPCCFSGRTDTPRLQICFCHAQPNGTIDRSLYYVIDTRLFVLINCFYFLGHVNEFVARSVSRVVRNDAEDDVDGQSELDRRTLNDCMSALDHVIRFPPCALSK